jgi:hypothetical protein
LQEIIIIISNLQQIGTGIVPDGIIINKPWQYASAYLFFGFKHQFNSKQGLQFQATFCSRTTVATGRDILRSFDNNYAANKQNL